MKIWHIFIAAVVLWIVFGGDDGAKSKSPLSSGAASYYRINSVPTSEDEESEDENEEEGEFDCTASNTSTGNGPYTLMCDRDGDEIRINFPNGGYIIVDEDGFHPRTGHFWNVDRD